jgi:ComF family protein
MFNFVMNFLFPKFCLVCGRYGKYLCVECCRKLHYLNKDICLYCEKERYLGATHPSCREENGVDGCISIFYYEHTLKQVIAMIKYRLVRDAFPELFSLMEKPCVQKITQLQSLINDLSTSTFVIQPIPLHASRLRQRGFNQSALIASFLTSKTGFNVIDALTRVKETQPQAKLHKHERQMNAARAFGLKKGIVVTNLSILLVDDVVTTGSTVKEAARVLKEAGACRIWVLSIAKG